MKSLIRSFLINILAIWLTSKVVWGLSYSNDLKVLALAAAVFGLVNLFIRPVAKLLLLPLNLITLGLFSWVLNVLMLYLSTTLVGGFEIKGFFFPGLVFEGFVIPAITVSTFWVAVLASFCISFIVSVLSWLVG